MTIQKSLYLHQIINIFNLMLIIKKLYPFFLILLFTGCASYYVKTLQFQDYLLKGKFEQANKWLDNDKKGQKPKNLLLHKLNRGYVERMTGNTEGSRQAFHETDLMIEDFRKKAGNEALAILVNPKVKPYQAEDFEAVMMHYYQAMNYIQLKKYEDAVVECRRMNIYLQKMNDKTKDHKPKYQRDAFAHNLMGMIYESRGKYNDAFIAYRNAYEIYTEDYTKYFMMLPPEQLKKDMLRTADYSGLYDLKAQYEKEFGFSYKRKPREKRELILFWETGWAPYKSEWSINFFSTNRNGMFVLYNEQLGLDFAFPINTLSHNERQGLGEIKSLRVAFPKLIERRPVYINAFLNHKGKQLEFEEIENVNLIAKKSLKDRMMRELGNALLRLAVKKGIEALIRKQSEGAGALVGLAGAIMEQADTRYWQALPYSIKYVRIPLEEGQGSVEVTTQSKHGNEKKQTITIDPKENGIQFFNFRSLESF